MKTQQNHYSPQQTVIFQNSNQINNPQFSNSKIFKSPPQSPFFQQTLKTPVKEIKCSKESSSKLKENVEEITHFTDNCINKKLFYYTNQILIANPNKQTIYGQNSTIKYMNKKCSNKVLQQQNITSNEQKNMNCFLQSNLKYVEQQKLQHTSMDHQQCNEIIQYLQEKIQLLLSEIDKLSKIIEIINKEKVDSKKQIKFSEKEKNVINLCEENIHNLQNQLNKQILENNELKGQLIEFSNIQIMQRDLQNQMIMLQQENQELYKKLQQQQQQIVEKQILQELDNNNLKESILTFEQTETKTNLIKEIDNQLQQQNSQKVQHLDMKQHYLRQNSYLKLNQKNEKYKKFEYSSNILSKILKTDEKAKNTDTIVFQQETLEKKNSTMDSYKKRSQLQQKGIK